MNMKNIKHRFKLFGRKTYITATPSLYFLHSQLEFKNYMDIYKKSIQT